MTVVARAALPLVLLAVARLPVDAQQPGQSMGGLKPDELKTARSLAEGRLKLGERERSFLNGEKPRDLQPGERIYLTNAEPAVVQDDGTKPRGLLPKTVILTYYRYGGDEAVIATVDLATKQVLKTERVPHLPTPLADEEVAEAEKLARDNDRVKALLAAYPNEKSEASVLVTQVGEQDKRFGHRLVVVMFRVGPTYLVSPRVLVDLTDQKVEVQEVKPPTGAGNRH